MSISIASAMVTVDSQDALALARWWSRATGAPFTLEHEEFSMLAPTDGLPTLGFQRVDDPTPGKNRLHLDLHVTDRVAAVDELVALGARLVADHAEGGNEWTTLADPDGNLFCVN
ncbi:VOC family protein [Sanguibacter sp. HDW7]|uniref:VOC family protein n=1 Tax=Sanguibacter sp. HDW7 TaxID=2714931 RepID=UPI00197D58C2|nr:VOC family protein [Sanguibacter sp. HDW7]